jgi:uncharacterized protein YlxW (UPF0749 family)
VLTRLQVSLSGLIKSLEDATVRQREEMEDQLRTREREMSELKDAYREKLRTCQAWKKVSGLLYYQ